jgi:hypothetical protein
LLLLLLLHCLLSCLLSLSSLLKLLRPAAALLRRRLLRIAKSAEGKTTACTHAFL